MHGRMHIDMAVLQGLQDVMAEDYPGLLEAYLDDSEERLRALREALRQCDAGALARTAHSFKGSCSNMGAVGLAQLCLELEQAGREASLDQAATLLRKVELEISVVRVLFRAERRRFA
ncbi:MAG TPA: Hpt domain-containing protein [Pseudomonas sp.]|nr:Hpt domain-containing protein [Pseudomonas sp.]